jgi:hypothetical protein
MENPHARYGMPCRTDGNARFSTDLVVVLIDGKPCYIFNWAVRPVVNKQKSGKVRALCCRHGGGKALTVPIHPSAAANIRIWLAQACICTWHRLNLVKKPRCETGQYR